MKKMSLGNSRKGMSLSFIGRWLQGDGSTTFLALSESGLDEDSPHTFGCRDEGVTATIPLLRC